MSGCMTLHPASTGYEPNVPNADANVDTSGARFAPAVDLTHDNDDAKSHMSDIPLQVPASANFFVEQLGIGHALTSRRRPRAKCSQSSTDTKSNRIRSLTITESPKCTSSPWTSRSGSNWLHNELETPWQDQRETARRAPPSTRRISCCHSSASKTLSTLWQETMKYTITNCRCKCSIFMKTK